MQFSKMVMELPKEVQAPEGRFTRKCVTSSQLFNIASPELLQDFIDYDEYLKQNSLISKLLLYGFSKKSLYSLLRCGKKTGGYVKSSCQCSEIYTPMTYHCSSRCCPICSKVRSRRLFRKYYPILKNFIPNSYIKLRFLTISPKNYDNLEYGMKHIRSSISKFFRLKYVKERVYGGLYVIETKTKNKQGDNNGWNIHAHIIYYGREMDNKLYGYCKNCNKNGVRLKFDKNNKKFYCSNKKCNSINVEWNGKNSKLVSLFEKSSKRQVNMDIKSFGSSSHMLGYSLKYISSNKDDFYTEDDFAKYIVYSKNRRLINTFGCFYKVKYNYVNPYCTYCDTEISFSFVSDISINTSILPIP